MNFTFTASPSSEAAPRACEVFRVMSWENKIFEYDPLFPGGEIRVDWDHWDHCVFCNFAEGLLKKNEIGER